MKNKVITFISIFLLAQILIWFQTYGQFKWEWMGKYTWLMIIAAMPITYLWIIGTRVGMEVFDGKSWPLLKKLNINEDELDSMEPSELKARIRDYNIDTILK